MSYDSVRLSSLNASDARRKNNQQNQLLEALKKSLYCGSLYHASLTELINNELMDILNDKPLINYENQRTRSLNRPITLESNKCSANFNLCQYIKENGQYIVSSDIQRYLQVSIPRIRKLSKAEKQRAINTYLEKKMYRNRNGQVRYQVRKDLATNRRRFKGKFIKDKKIDIKKAAQELINNELVKEFVCFKLFNN